MEVKHSSVNFASLKMLSLDTGYSTVDSVAVFAPSWKLWVFVFPIHKKFPFQLHQAPRGSFSINKIRQ